MEERHPPRPSEGAREVSRAWERMMEFCDGNSPYQLQGADDVELEHLRTDIIAHNDKRLEQIAALKRALALHRSMVLGSESESDQSRAEFDAAMNTPGEVERDG